MASTDRWFEGLALPMKWEGDEMEREAEEKREQGWSNISPEDKRKFDLVAQIVDEDRRTGRARRNAREMAEEVERRMSAR